MDRERIEEHVAPSASPPYSSAVRVEGGESLLFVSGQLPVNPESGEIDSLDVAKQTTMAMQNALRVVDDNGSAVTDVVKVGIFTTCLSEISDINASYLKVLGDHRPARSLVEVSALPRQALVEIEMVVRAR